MHSALSQLTFKVLARLILSLEERWYLDLVSDSTLLKNDFGDVMLDYEDMIKL